MFSKENIQNIYRLSPMQKNIYYNHVNNINPLAYFSQFVYRISSNFDVNLMKKSYFQLVQENDVLRTVFVQKSDEMLQVVLKEREPDFYYEDISHYSNIEEGIKKHKEEEKNRLFNLKSDNLIRLKVLKLDEELYELIWSFHHIILDGWSLSILMSRFIDIYYKNQPYINPPQYNTYIRWLEKKDINKAKSYWSSYLEGYEEGQTLWPDKKNNSKNEYHQGSVTLKLTPKETMQLSQLAQNNHTTLNTLINTIWGVLLAKYTDKRDVVFGTVVSGRPTEIINVNEIIGLFINTVPTRIKFDENTKFSQLLKDAQMDYVHSEPFHFIELTEIQVIKKQSIIDHFIAFENYPTSDSLNELRRNSQEDENTFKVLKSDAFEQNNYDFSLIIVPKSQLEFQFLFNLSMYTKEYIERLSKHLKKLISNILLNVDSTIDELEIMTDEEKKLILHDFNNTECEYPINLTINKLFKIQAEKCPHETALIYNDKKMTYAELDEKSDKLAMDLRNKGIETGSCVGLMLNRSFELIVGILGILKAGGIYVPIDTSMPLERKQYILQDCNAKILITQKELWELNQETNLPIILLDHGYPFEMISTNNEVLENLNSSTDAAYIIYTSGSSGRPKGVVIEHHSVINRLIWQAKTLNMTSEDLIMQKTSISFDVSIFELFTWFLSGGKLYLLEQGDEKDSLKIIEAISKHNVSTIHFVPSMFHVFLNTFYGNEELLEQISSLKYILTSGEELLSHDVVEFFNSIGNKKSVKLINQYGPTEATVDVSFYECQQDRAEDIIPIGKPINNTKLFIVNSRNKLLPIGVPGELCIGGVGVAREYLNNPLLTKEKFINCLDFYNGKLYKTGDKVRWMVDGNIEFLGRIDSQVKVRGYRIEIGEVENRMMEIEGIKNVAVLAKKDRNNMTSLYAYYIIDYSNDHIMDRNHVNEAFRLKEELSRTLPDYMIPSFFIQLEEIPMLTSGKVDRKALTMYKSEMENDSFNQLPDDEIQSKLFDIWREVLEVNNLDINTDFFQLGGHSLNAIILCNKIKKEFNVEIQVGKLFQYPTIKQISEIIKNEEKIRYYSIGVSEKTGYYPMSAQQKRLYILSQMENTLTSYNMPQSIIIEGNIDKIRLEEAFKNLIKRHETLRTSFLIKDGQLVQKIHSNIDLSIDYIDGSEKDLDQIIKAYIQPFNLGQVPLVRVAFVELTQTKHMLIYDMHHMISDGISMKVIMRELTMLYEEKELPQLRIQYGDYAVWQEEFLKTERIKMQEAYWMSIFNNDIPELKIPCDFPIPDRKTYEGDIIFFDVDVELTKAIKKITTQTGTTLYMVMLAAYNVILSKYAGQEDIIVGSPIAGRPHSDLDNLIGLFINTLAMRNQPAADKTFKEFLYEVKNNSIQAFENQDYQLDSLVEKLGIKNNQSRNSLFDTMLIMQKFGAEVINIEELKFIPYKIKYDTSKFNFKLEVFENNEVLSFSFDYNIKLFKRETMVTMLEYFVEVLRIISQNLDIKISDIKKQTTRQTEEILNDFNDDLE